MYRLLGCDQNGCKRWTLFENEMNSSTSHNLTINKQQTRTKLKTYTKYIYNILPLNPDLEHQGNAKSRCSCLTNQH